MRALRDPPRRRAVDGSRPRHRYDEYNSYPTMFGIHLFVQLCCFVVVFLMLCETYPFRVGLVEALLAEFRAVLWIHPTRGARRPADGRPHAPRNPDLAR